jgi:hypothetical protein
LLGLPVSGIERITPAPLLKEQPGPDWLTGGASGIEGAPPAPLASGFNLVIYG